MYTCGTIIILEGDIYMEFFRNIKYAWKFTKDQKGLLALYIFCNLIAVVISVVVPIFGAKKIIYVTNNQLYQLILVALLIFLIEISRNVVNSITSYCSQIIYREAFTKIQTSLGDNILKLSNKSIDDNSSGVFIQRLTNDTSRLADIFNVLNMYLSNIITDLGIFGALFIINKWVFLYILIMVIFIFLVENHRSKVVMEKDKEFRKIQEKATGFIGELVRGARDIKMLDAENSFLNELHKKLVDVNGSRYDMQAVNRKYRFFSGSLRDLYDLLLIVLLSYFLFKEYLAVASAIVVVNYSNRVTSVVYYFGGFIDQIKDFNLSCSRIFAIMEGDEFPKETFGEKHIDKVNGDFEFKNVKFSYGEEKVLKGVSFKIKANETVAFVGKSGAGKTTIFNLLCKMYDVDSGKITIDGIDIKTLDKESIRGNITIISQNPYIFNLSVKDNLRLVKEGVTDAEIVEACKMACLDEFIECLPEKYDTVVGEGGVNLSGGQKQRLAIARALVQKTEIILFDEATSALDNETQAKIQQAIDNMKNEYTILIIAHRLSTIINADRILLLDNGKIVAEGSHKELLKNNKLYKELYNAEIKK